MSFLELAGECQSTSCRATPSRGRLKGFGARIPIVFEQSTEVTGNQHIIIEIERINLID